MALGLKISTPNNNYYSDSTQTHYIIFIEIIDENLFSKITPLSLDNCHLLLTNSFGSTCGLTAAAGTRILQYYNKGIAETITRWLANYGTLEDSALLYLTFIPAPKPEPAANS
jgi:hypothetical protein